MLVLAKTDVAVLTPLFVTVILYTIVCPRLGVLLSTVILTFKSTAFITVIVIFAMLFVKLRSYSVLLTFDVKVYVPTVVGM